MKIDYSEPLTDEQVLRNDPRFKPDENGNYSDDQLLQVRRERVRYWGLMKQADYLLTLLWNAFLIVLIFG